MFNRSILYGPKVEMQPGIWWSPLTQASTMQTEVQIPTFCIKLPVQTMLGGSDQRNYSFWLEETGGNCPGRRHLTWVFPTGEGKSCEGDRAGRVVGRQQWGRRHRDVRAEMLENVSLRAPSVWEIHDLSWDFTSGPGACVGSHEPMQS